LKKKSTKPLKAKTIKSKEDGPTDKMNETTDELKAGDDTKRDNGSGESNQV